MAASDDLRRVQLDYIKMGTVLAAQTLHALAEVGQQVVREADANAPASKIHGSLSSTANITGRGVTVAMRISGAKSKGAGPAFESISGKPTFRHPLFGDRDHWYTQAARPFLKPALDRKARDAERQIADVVEKAARASGW